MNNQMKIRVLKRVWSDSMGWVGLPVEKPIDEIDLKTLFSTPTGIFDFRIVKEDGREFVFRNESLHAEDDLDY